MQNLQENLEDILKKEFAPKLVEVKDESASHAGHAGARPGGDSHFAVLLVSEKFSGKSRVERQKMVFAVLKNGLMEEIHALRFNGLFTPEEFSQST